MAALRVLDPFLGGCERLFRLLANLLLLTMLAINLLNIATRFVTDQGIVWVFPLTTVMFVWMTFLGFFVVYRQGKDITVDILVDRIGATARRLARVLVDLAVLGLLTVLLVEAPALLERQVGNIEMVGIQRYWLSVPFFASAALIMLHFVADLLHAFHGDAQPHHRPAGDI